MKIVIKKIKREDIFLIISLILCFDNLSIPISGGQIRFGYFLFFAYLILVGVTFKKNYIIALSIMPIYFLAIGLGNVTLRTILMPFLIFFNLFLYGGLFAGLKKISLFEFTEAVTKHIYIVAIAIVLEIVIFQDRPHLFFKEPSYLAIYLCAFIFPILAMKNWKHLLILIFLLLLTQSFFALVAITITLSIVFIQLLISLNVRKYMLMVTLALAVFLIWPIISENRYLSTASRIISADGIEAVFNLLLNRGGSRFDRMLSAVDYIKKEIPLFGVGAGNFVTINNLNPHGYVPRVQNGGPATNIFVEFTVEAGIVTSLLFSGLAIYWLMKNMTVKWIYLAPVLLTMLFESSYVRPSFWLAATLALSVYLKIKYIGRDESNEII